MNHTPVITFSKVTFSYANGRVLFKDLSLTFGAGSFYTIQGPSGAGKSSLLRLINRLEEPDSGEITFKGKPLSTYYPPVLRRSILYIQQTPAVISGSVRANLLLPYDFKNNRNLETPSDDQLRMLLDDFRLDRVDLGENARNLSVGQLQRLCFIRGLLLSPEVVLLDEPTSALDKESSRIVEGKMETLCSESGVTVIMVRHGNFQPVQISPIILEVRENGIRETP